MTAPFDDIRALLNDLSPAPLPQGADPALGRLGEAAAFMKTWRGEAAVNRPIVALYAGSTGIDPDGVRAALEAVAAGAAPAARLAQAAGAGLEAFDLAIDRPTATMSERECAATMAFGMEALSKQPDLLLPAVLSDDGGAAAAAVALALWGGQASDWTADHAGPVQAAVDRLEGEAHPLEILRQLGGRPMAAVAGAIVAARVQGIPVLLDGYASCAAAAVLQAARPDAIDHCLAGAASAEPGHARMLAKMGLRPLADLQLPQEDGSGALAALQLLKAACAAAG